MNRLRSILRQKQGTTLVEVVCAGFLLILFIGMCASALRPAAAAVARQRLMLDAQSTADIILARVRTEVEEARAFIGISHYAGGDVLKFVNKSGCTMYISSGADGDAGPETREGAAENPEQMAFGRLLYRYFDDDDALFQAGTPETRVEGAVYTDDLYMGLYLALRFEPVLESGKLMRIKITAQLGKDVEMTSEGPVVSDVIYTQHEIADLRYAMAFKNGVKVKAGLPVKSEESEQNWNPAE